MTSVLYQPFAFGAVVGAALRFGAVLSMLMPLTVVLALLPALSTAVPSTDWSAPSARCCGAGHRVDAGEAVLRRRR